MKIPPQMQHLPKDRRGYPIPVGVLIDDDGRPHFTVNDELKRQQTIRRNLCAICGKKLLKVRWLVGGPGSAFHYRGSYIDPPMHEACAKYALTVCPYLAAPSYSKRIDDRTVDPAKIPGTVIFNDPTMMDHRPAVFVLAMTVGQGLIMEGDFVRYIVPRRPLRKVEYWQGGQRIPDEQGALLAQQFLETL